MSRRRVDRDTVPEPFVSMRELARQWHEQLRKSAGPVHADGQATNSTKGGE